MDIQFVAAAVIVGLAAAYSARATWRVWAGKKSGCSSGCGKCAAPPAPAGPEQKGRVSLPQV
ncbi:MAG: hypothetical protein JWO38_2935 [Gemmataceae bacterium]|nr:hypothetical protein [Gemmataceae bacterium]